MKVGMYKLECLQNCKFKKELVVVLDFDNYSTAEHFAEVFDVVSAYDPLGYYGPKLLRLSNHEDYPDSMLDGCNSFARDCWSGELFSDYFFPVKMWVTDEKYTSWALNVVRQTTYVLKHNSARDMQALVRHCYDKMDDGEY